MSTICMNPFTLSEENGGHQVPCGKCYNCKRRRASNWSVRLMEQSKHSVTSSFITLTYDTKYVPITPKGFMSLSKKHLQDFFKRLREKHETKISYYAVGEYGGKTYRPHYHIILFNADIVHVQDAWSECLNKKQRLYRELGSVHFGQLTEASVGYTLKYICKAKRIPLHANDDRLPEFSLMSKGLGKDYLTKKKIEWHKNKLEERVYIPLQDGKKAPMPRYYKQKMYDESEKERIAYHHKKKNDLLNEQLVKQHGDSLQCFKEQQYFNGQRKLNKIETLKI